MTHNRIFYRIEGEGIPVLMIHGFASDHHILSGCMEPIFSNASFSKKFKRIYFDLPGMGQSPSADWMHNADDLVAVIAEFITEIIMGEPFLICAQSYGAYLARGVMDLFWNTILGILFICPVIIPLHKHRTRPPLTVLKKDPALLEKITPYDKKKYTQIAVIQSDYTWQRYRAEFLPGIKSCDRDFFHRIRSQYALQKHPYQEDCIFTKPTLFLMGHQDSVVGFSDQLAVIDQFPHGNFIILDKAGHNLPAEQPILFESLSSEWISHFIKKRIVS